MRLPWDVTPQREATMEALLKDFRLYSLLKGYGVYRR
jgi:hypothetical protein